MTIRTYDTSNYFIYNTLLQYGFKREVEKDILKVCFSDKKSEYMNWETDGIQTDQPEELIEFVKEKNRDQ